MSWPYDADWEAARPGPGPAGAVGLNEHEAATDPYRVCEGFNYENLDFTETQKKRLNELARVRGTLANCQHDLAGGIEVGKLLGSDGDFKGNDLYEGPVTRNIHRLAELGQP